MPQAKSLPRPTDIVPSLVRRAQFLSLTSAMIGVVGLDEILFRVA